MIIACAPGGPTSNLISHLAKGDVALSISLTAVSSVLTVFTIPLIINFSLIHFLGEGKTFTLPKMEKTPASSNLEVIRTTSG